MTTKGRRTHDEFISRGQGVEKTPSFQGGATFCVVASHVLQGVVVDCE